MNGNPNSRRFPGRMLTRGSRPMLGVRGPITGVFSLSLTMANSLQDYERKRNSLKDDYTEDSDGICVGLSMERRQLERNQEYKVNLQLSFDPSVALIQSHTLYINSYYPTERRPLIL
jgi:hypothetical protein